MPYITTQLYKLNKKIGIRKTVLADVLFGKVNPSGKLPITFPRNVGQIPLFYNKLETGRARWIYNSDPAPVFSFGHGLSYSTFKLDT